MDLVAKPSLKLGFDGFQSCKQEVRNARHGWLPSSKGCQKSWLTKIHAENLCFGPADISENVGYSGQSVVSSVFSNKFLSYWEKSITFCYHYLLFLVLILKATYVTYHQNAIQPVFIPLLQLCVYSSITTFADIFQENTLLSCFNIIKVRGSHLEELKKNWRYPDKTISSYQNI